MKKKCKSLLAVLAVLLILLCAVGCGRKKTETPVAETPAPTVAPTATPSPAPTPLKPPVVSATPRPQPKTTIVEDPDGGTMRQVEIENEDGSTTTITIRHDDSEGEAAAETAPQESAAPISQEIMQMAGEFEWFQALSPEEQYAYSMTFDPYEKFFDWYNAAKEAYDATRQVIVLGPGDYIEVD